MLNHASPASAVSPRVRLSTSRADTSTGGRRPVGHGWNPDPRDLQILRFLIEGLTTEAIARRLDISDRTVRRRLQSSADALGVSSTLQVVVEAVRRRLI
jgi:DNA-binding NarL/FixJ family response regulator